MMQLNLFQDKNHNYRLLIDKPISCDKCDTELIDHCTIKTVWGKKSKHFILCSKCVSKVSSGLVDEYKFVIIDYVLGRDFVPVIIQPPQLRSSRDGDVFSVADVSSVPVNKDHAKSSGRTPSIEDAQIGNNDLKFIEEKDKGLSEGEGLSLLDDL